MQVKSIALGYYGHIRVKPGVVFEMDESVAMAAKDKEGKPCLPRWVVPADQAVEDKGLKLPGHKVVKKAKYGAAVPEAKPSKSTGDEDVI